MRPFATALVFLLSSLASGQTPAVSTPSHPVVDSYPGGLTVTDNYRWLEDSASPETKAWVAAENAYSTKVLDALPQRDKLLATIRQQRTTQQTAYYSFAVNNRRLFAMRYDPGDAAQKLVTFAGPDDKASEREVLNLGKIKAGTLYQESWYAVSPDGKLVGMALSQGGSEDGALHVFSVATGQPVDEVLPHVQFATAGGAMAWKADSTGYYYTRYPRGTERAAADVNFYQQLYFHKLGTPTEADTSVLGRELPRIAEISITASPDRTHFLISVENGDGGEYALYVIGPDGAVQPISAFADRITSATFGVDNSLWLLSRKTSARGAMLHLPSATSKLSDATLVVPPGDANLESNDFGDGVTKALALDERLYLTVINGGPEQVRVYTLDGKRLPDLATPPVASIGTLLRFDNNSFLFNAATYTAPRQWYQQTGNAAPRSLPFRNFSAISLADVEVERVFATSKDGTKVPMTLLHRKGLKLDGANPTILYGYGGYGISMTPFFTESLRPLFDAGGIYAIANIRGGAEYGEDWHRGGNLLNKQNVFDDFAACAQFLVDRRYTSSAHLAAEGGSNGGLLMGAMITQHPSLFKAVLSYVGIYDMLRVELDPNGAFNTSEFGSTKDPAQLRALYAYSPYHHVHADTAYPATLFITGDNDHRVNPLQSRKMVALLQADTSSKAPILLLTNANAGHGVSTNINEADLENADALAFIYAQIGLVLP